MDRMTEKTAFNIGNKLIQAGPNGVKKLTEILYAEIIQHLCCRLLYSRKMFLHIMLVPASGSQHWFNSISLAILDDLRGYYVLRVVLNLNIFTSMH